MKNKIFLISLIFIAVVAGGCHKNKDQTTSQQLDQQLDKAQAETKETAQDIKDFTQKTEFIAKMKCQLTEINKDLDYLTTKIEGSSDEIKTEAKPKLQALRNQMDQLNQQLEDLKNATNTWDGVKENSRKSYNELKEGFNQVRQWVSDQNRPLQ